MNKEEQETAKLLLQKILSAEADEVVQFATSYQLLAQGALCRKQAEVTK